MESHREFDFLGIYNENTFFVVQIQRTKDKDHTLAFVRKKIKKMSCSI